jgi:hypothetical protein
MTKNVLASIFASARELLRNAGALALLVVLYLALIAACFFFITTREATVWQVFLTALTAAGAPLLFFIVQAACASFAVGARDPKELLRTTARSFGKLVAISLPLILAAVLCVYLLNKLENRVKPTPEERARAESSMSTPDEEAESAPATPQSKPPVRWGYLFVSPCACSCSESCCRSSPFISGSRRRAMVSKRRLCNLSATSPAPSPHAPC